MQNLFAYCLIIIHMFSQYRQILHFDPQQRMETEGLPVAVCFESPSLHFKFLRILCAKVPFSPFLSVRLVNKFIRDFFQKR